MRTKGRGCKKVVGVDGLTDMFRAREAVDTSTHFLAGSLCYGISDVVDHAPSGSRNPANSDMVVQSLCGVVCPKVYETCSLGSSSVEESRSEHLGDRLTPHDLQKSLSSATGSVEAHGKQCRLVDGANVFDEALDASQSTAFVLNLLKRKAPCVDESLLENDSHSCNKYSHVRNTADGLNFKERSPLGTVLKRKAIVVDELLSSENKKNKASGEEALLHRHESGIFNGVSSPDFYAVHQSSGSHEGQCWFFISVCGLVIIKCFCVFA